LIKDKLDCKLDYQWNETFLNLKNRLKFILIYQSKKKENRNYK